MGGLLPEATYKRKGLLGTNTYSLIPQLLKTGKTYNAIKIAENVGPWVRQTISIFGFIPAKKTLPFLGYVWFTTTETNLTGGGQLLSQKDNSEGLLQLYYKQNGEAFSVYLVTPAESSSDINNIYIAGPYECVREKISLDDSFKQIPLNIIGG